MSSERIGPWIRTYTGGKFYLLDPRPEDIKLVDLAHHLALIPRFTGAVIYPYSVAEHSYRVAREVQKIKPGIYLEALLHDAAEAYIGDMNRPLKHYTPVGEPYRMIEGRIEEAVIQKFMLAYSPEIMAFIKEMDQRLYETEKRDLLTPLGGDPNVFPPIRQEPRPQALPGVIYPMRWQDAEKTFYDEVSRVATARIARGIQL